MKKLILLFCLIFLLNHISSAQVHKIIENTSDYIKIEINFERAYQVKPGNLNGEKFYTIEGKDSYFRFPGEPQLPEYKLNIGIPFNATPVVKIVNISQEKSQNIFILPTPDSLNQSFNLLPYNKEIYNSNMLFPQSTAFTEEAIMRYAHIAVLNISPYQFNPVSRELIFNKKIVVQIDFKTDPNNYTIVNKVIDKMTDDLLKSSVVNYNIAKEFVGKPETYPDNAAMADTYWYNPQKDYYKFYLNQKGVYRITYEMLVNEGVPAIGLQNNRLELFNNGVSIPIDVVDVNNDSLFNSGDYFQFVGEPVKPVDQFTRMNIYNHTNVYWFSYQADTLNYYKSIDGYPSGSSSYITNSVKTLKWEKDLYYQRLGHAPNNQRDYWYWGSAEAVNGIPTHRFEFSLEDNIWSDFVIEKPQVKLKVGLHGLTDIYCPDQTGHNTTVYFNYKPIGSVNWNEQESALFEKDFFMALYTFGGGDTVQLLWNSFQDIIVQQNGNNCADTLTDIALINYFEFQYWRWHRAESNYFHFTSPPNDFGENIYYVFRWPRNNMKVYIPSRGELIANPLITNDADLSVRFMDTIFQQTDYYCVADDYFILPDSISHHPLNSDLRNTANGADYIIITHPDFRNAAENLAAFRSSNLSGYSSPRVKVVDVFDIYNEFSYGLLNPFALQYFAKYVFENWQVPAPAFITLLGDASYDIRRIDPSSRKNYIPSIPFHGNVGNFGQLPSDNSIVMVAGTDFIPDIALGRLSCETLEEANTLVDKIITYPIDNSKTWKENAILLASGLSYTDQVQHQFNNYAKRLENNHLLPNGLRSTKVFNYPDPQDSAFIGNGPRMRQEINNGATVVSYYGHGGGGQWDLIFTIDDIPELNNAGRLPFISSITCYTAHFDNATSFGEVFTRIPNKGAIGFWGSVSLTWWPTGANMNDSLFKQIFTRRNYVVGSAILGALVSPGSGFSLMIPQITYLGDPALELIIPKAPDFEIKSADISIFPQNPLKEDTVLVTINFRNLGVTFPGDSVTVELFKNIPDAANLIGETKIPSFGQSTSTNFQWFPQEAGLYNLIVRVNEKDIIAEVDHSDNISSASFSVYDFGEPNIIKPVNGYFTQNAKVDFVLSDIGFYFDRNFNYLIQIHNSLELNGPVLVQSPVLNPVDGIVKWQTQSLAPGEYFWRAVIFDPIDTNYSPVKVFSVTNENGSGYLSKKKQLQLFNLSNVYYSEQLGSLILNSEVQPPHPEGKFFLDSIMIDLPEDSTWPATFTTDGSYFYFGNLPEWVNESKIYKIGTGLNGTVRGLNYGAIPDPLNSTEDLYVYIYSHLFYKDGYLFTSTGPMDNLLQIDTQTGDTTRVILSDSLLLTVERPNQIGGFYFYYDGKYLYNLAMGTSNYPDKFVLRTFDPSNNWSKMGEDILFTGGLIRNISSFIVANGSVIIYENLFSTHLRRYRLSDGVYEEEWAVVVPARDYYTIGYDYVNNFVYFGSFSPIVGDYEPGFIKYAGTYIEANGKITTQEIGPASQWHNLEFDIDQTNSDGKYKAYLSGKSRSSGNWEVLDTVLKPNISLADIDVNEFDYIRMNFDLIDSSFGAGEPLKFNSFQVNYDFLPEISLIPKDMTFIPDSMLQGIDVNMNLKVNNLGYVAVDSLKLDFYLNDGDSVFFTKYISVQPDSFTIINQAIQTDTIIFETKLKTIASTPKQEYFTYNNLIENDFYVARDSVKPVFSITFDGKEILDGDIVSSQPEVVITLKDDSPLPPKEEHFTIIYDSEPLFFTPDTLVFDVISGYPNSEARVTWTPNIKKDGIHTFEVLAKDASGNFFDSTSYRVSFYVFNESDLRDVYNYPNPFENNTYFTFELRGVNVPDEFRIRIFTIAGRMIKEIDIPPSSLRIGFNRILWDGRDHDGDEIANGLYFYKVVYKNEEVVKTKIQKLAKVK